MNLMIAYTDLVAEKIGDEDDFLGWWCWECDFGRSPKQAARPGGRMVKINTLEKLAKVIA